MLEAAASRGLQSGHALTLWQSGYRSGASIQALGTADPSAGHGGITSCGWKYALGRHKLVHFDVSAGSAYEGATSTCKACIRAAARRDSLGDVSDENDSE